MTGRLRIQSRREVLILLVGDLVVWFLVLWLTLVIRYQAWPTVGDFTTHLGSFGYLFAVWVLVFFIADLYRPSFFISPHKLARAIINAQAANSLLAVIFFYFIPIAGITPKVNLFIYLALATILISWWRLKLVSRLSHGGVERVAFLCAGAEVSELTRAIESRFNQHFRLVEATDLAGARAERATIIVINTYDELYRDLRREVYNLIFDGVRVLPFHVLYEEVFSRIPLSVIDEHWFVENAQNLRRPFYDTLKRLMDFVLSLTLFLITLPLYPIIIILIKLGDNGPIFFTESRIGRDNKIIHMAKFRSMTTEADLTARQVTKVGQLLRRTRLDELPQLWSVLLGIQSLVGPRPERPDYVELYNQQIPYYPIRHLISPGLSGWAQIYHERHPHFRPSVEATREKLSYDLFYLKNRSLPLDLAIGLKTIRILLSQTGI